MRINFALRVATFAAFTLVLGQMFTIPAAAQEANWRALEAETGCQSRYSDDKKADIFAANYKDREMTVTGQVADVSGARVSIKILSSTLISDLRVRLSNPKAAYDLEKGQRITVRFIMRSAGGCIVDYEGDQGAIY
jgi:hypothetical protein